MLNTSNESIKQQIADDLEPMNRAIDTMIRHCTLTTLNDNDTIARSSQTLVRLCNGPAILLLARAKARSKKGRLSEAISDALQAIEYQPTLTDAYVAAGIVYSTQGNQQAAIDICERGLRAVLPSEWPLLYEIKVAAEEQLDQRIDFMTRLPTEVATDVFAQLDNHPTLASCVYVSKLWCHSLLYRCPRLWRTAVINRDSLHTDPTVRFLPSVSNHVQQLSLQHVPNHTLQLLIDMVNDDKLTSVTGLELEANHDSIVRHMDFLALLGSSVTSLDILLPTSRMYLPDDPIILDLNHIMILCPSVEYLRLESFHKIAYDPLQVPISYGYWLQGLAICTDQVNRLLEAFIPQCPELKELIVNECSPKAISLLIHHCPQLKRLEIDSAAISKSFNYIAYEQNGDGLQTFKYFVYNDIAPDMTAAIIHSKETLQTLEVYLPGLDTRGMRELALGGFDQLAVLDFFVDERQLENIASMIRRSPTLEDVSLTFGEGTILTDRFLACLTQERQSLHTLHLGSFHSFSSQEYPQFIAHHATRRQEPRLQSIAIGDCELITIEMVSAIADIPTLQRIELYNVSIMRTTDDSIEAFAKKLHTLPYLKIINFNGIPQITDDMVVQLGAIDGLNQLSLSSLSRVTSDGIRMLADCSSCTLNSVRVFNCLGVDEDAVHYLNSKLVTH